MRHVSILVGLVAGASLAWPAMVAAQAIAVAESGTADAGVASRPIANVAANDSINNAPATLGASGNATVAQTGPWPAGIALTPSTGAVSTKVSVAIGTYGVEYTLCEKVVPTSCSSVTDTVAVVNGSVQAVPESGTVPLGFAKTAIPNVAANDTVHGVAAVLGASGNASVRRMNAWPPGIALNTATGAITSGASVAAGVYSVEYTLCDTNTPQECSDATDTVTVAASIIALPVSGSAFVGKSSTAIGNTIINDSVNGALPTLGASGNATLAQLGAWTPGITLNTSTGAISVDSSTAVGSYPVAYQLCDRQPTADCASATDNVIVTNVSIETLASSTVIGDIEFDWGRDGINCPQCNDGLGNMRFNWTDRKDDLWVSGIDPNTGLFVPASGQATLVDNTAAFWQATGNGPEWTFSTPPGSQTPISQLVYTRYTPGQPATFTNAGVAFAGTANGTWSVAFLPGAIGAGMNSVLPEGTMCNTDPLAYVLYANIASPQQQFTEPVSSAPGTAPTQTNFGSYSDDIGERWVACTHWLTFQGDVTVGSNTIQQVFWYNADTQTVQQVTTDNTTKSRALMFKAPELLGTPYPYMMVMIASNNRIQVYQQTGVSSNGAPSFTLYNTIYSPDPTEPFLFDPKTFVHCTPTCHTYVAMGISHLKDPQFTQTEANGLAVTNIDAVNPLFKVLIPYSSTPLSQRQDPEYFITPNGAYLYYAELLVQTKTQPYQEIGFHFIDMQLGLPSGPCVGSSAEAGLAGPVGICQ